jgi:hypothetical protein
VSARARVRVALRDAGGVPARGAVHEGGARPIAQPFGPSRVVEGRAVRARAVAAAQAAPDGVAFLAAIQRYVIDGHFGLVPVVRARVAAAALARRQGGLARLAGADEEFLVVPGGRLDHSQRAAMRSAELPVVESEAGPAPHPLLDRWAAVRAIDLRRAACERRVAQRALEASDGPLVVDRPLAGLADLPDRNRVIAVVRRHETLYLEGDDLAVALTLPAGHRSSVFAWSADHGTGGGDPTYSWYLRLWPGTDEDLLHGLVRVERKDPADPAAEADRVSGWLLAERAPIPASEPDWDRRLYPVARVEAYLRAHAGGWH